MGTRMGKRKWLCLFTDLKYQFYAGEFYTVFNCWCSKFLKWTYQSILKPFKFNLVIEAGINSEYYRNKQELSAMTASSTVGSVRLTPK